MGSSPEKREIRICRQACGRVSKGQFALETGGPDLASTARRGRVSKGQFEFETGESKWHLPPGVAGQLWVGLIRVNPTEGEPDPTPYIRLSRFERNLPMPGGLALPRPPDPRDPIQPQPWRVTCGSATMSLGFSSQFSIAAMRLARRAGPRHVDAPGLLFGRVQPNP